MKHPIQPLAKDEHGVLRFKPNKIVQHLLDNGGIDLKQLARLEFSQEDREQFAQLIGYSQSGFGELSYVTEETFQATLRMAEGEKSEEQNSYEARIDALESMLEDARSAVRSAAVTLFQIHPDDLHA